MFNYDYAKINLNMPIKILQTFSGSYHFISIKQNKMINVYFHEPLWWKIKSPDNVKYLRERV